MKIISPQTAKDFEKYFALRYEVLRKPWNQPKDSEKDDMEQESLHAMVVDENEFALGVCRMQYNSAEEAQLRFMGIRSDMQGKGLGKMLLDHFEKIASEKGATKIILQARENALSFYKRNGYEVKEKTKLMWGVIQHYLMEKKLH